MPASPIASATGLQHQAARRNIDNVGYSPTDWKSQFKSASSVSRDADICERLAGPVVRRDLDEQTPPRREAADLA
ncbi:MAG: hypothetical protein ACREHD_24415 [Pirellulales bacterium]